MYLTEQKADDGRSRSALHLYTSTATNHQMGTTQWRRVQSSMLKVQPQLIQSRVYLLFKEMDNLMFSFQMWFFPFQTIVKFRLSVWSWV